MERGENSNSKEIALITNFDWSAEIAEAEEEINHALMAEVSTGERNKSEMKEEVTEKECESVKEESGAEEKDVKADDAAKVKKEVDDEKEEERKNTPVCNCEKALAAEKIVMGLPYEV
ncbi:hypothetical protein QVD17_38033 [Tagetes erecta]|uniref:Uncharacterized protein n=1 Tax=Tagetes erecta TaxID=13708 RepID=A0AAD8NJ27_TARER|nr:hypothetical protein QVD17_38033 [Tagetes erecta]